MESQFPGSLFAASGDFETIPDLSIDANGLARDEEYLS
jgi:hypothetical protein